MAHATPPRASEESDWLVVSTCRIVMETLRLRAGRWTEKSIALTEETSP